MEIPGKLLNKFGFQERGQNGNLDLKQIGTRICEGTKVDTTIMSVE